MTTRSELKDALRRKYVLPLSDTSQPATPVVSDADSWERAFVVEGKSGRVTIAGPAHTAANVEKAEAANKGFLYIDGRFVEADVPNRNGAYWATSDLELGQVTVAGGPLNWLHDENMIIGTLLQSSLVYREAAATGTVGTHLTARSAMWRFLHPDKARMIESASTNNLLWYSMECVSEKVQCLDTPGSGGCGEEFPYGDYINGRTCAHLRERSSVRRLIQPTFLGGAIIVPPVQPGWANAEASVTRQAAELTEREHLDRGPLSQGEAVEMVSAIINYANRTIA